MQVQKSKIAVLSKLDAVHLGPTLWPSINEYLGEKNVLPCVDFDDINRRMKLVHLFPIVPELLNQNGNVVNVNVADAIDLQRYGAAMKIYDTTINQIQKDRESNTKIMDMHRTANLVWPAFFEDSSPLSVVIRTHALGIEAAVKTAEALCNTFPGGVNAMEVLLRSGAPIPATNGRRAAHSAYVNALINANPISSFRFAYSWLKDYTTANASTFGVLLTEFNALSDNSISWGEFELQFDRLKNAISSAGQPLAPNLIEFTLCKAVTNIHLSIYKNELSIDMTLPPGTPRTHTEASFRLKARTFIALNPQYNTPTSKLQAFSVQTNHPSRTIKKSMPHKPLRSAILTSTSKRVRIDPTLVPLPGSKLALYRLNNVPIDPTIPCRRCFRKGHYYLECKSSKCFKCHRKFKDFTEYHDSNDPLTCK